MDPTAQRLFDYLKDILYKPDQAQLDLNTLPSEFQELGMGMQFLADCIRETRTFAKAMARGDLSQTPPSIENVIAAPITELQGALRHLAWQTQQVAKGDYSQRVDFMGTFSEAFNTMTDQLAARTQQLVTEKEQTEEKNRALSRTLELVTAMGNYTHNMIFALANDTGRHIFVNQPAEWFCKAFPELSAQLLHRLHAHKEDAAPTQLWDLALEMPREEESIYYCVESIYVDWSGESAAVHILTDDTERRRQERLFFNLAYLDPLTGLHNRRYAMEQMEHWRREGKPFLLTFIDVDYLKYCNDNFGHRCGDQYLVDISNALHTLGGILCRVGGDEFILLRTGEELAAQEKQLAALRQALLADQSCAYPKSFSYATAAVPVNPPLPLELYLEQTDAQMYRYKLEHKKPLSDLLYRDKRI